MQRGDKVIYQDNVYKIDDIDPDGNCIIETLEVFDMGVTCQAIVEYAHVRELKPVEEPMNKYPAGPASKAAKMQDKENVKKSKENDDYFGTFKKINKVLGK